MAVDRYTKTVLTVIAGCLVWLCAVGTPGPAHAQQPVTLQNPTSHMTYAARVVGQGRVAVIQ